MLRENLSDLKSDKLLILSLFVCFSLSLCHSWQFIKSSYSIEPLIRLIFCSFYVLGVLFFKRKYFYPFFFIYALALVYFNKFNNYTSFFIICIIAFKNPKYKLFMFSAYAIDVIMSLFIGGRQASHALIHILNCSFIFAFFQLELCGKPKLKLTADEITILNEWSRSGELKAIESFSKNSVFKKLKEARERNRISTNEELLERYKSESINTN